MIRVQLIHYGSKEYQQEVELRSKVLREPLGRRLTDEELVQGQDDIHIGAFSNEALVGCLLLKPLSRDCIKMRQVAVSPSQQGQGVGKRLVDFAETMARQQGFNEIILNARQTAVPFYESLGYKTEGDVFEEVTLPHFKMKKRIEETR
jgi:hypothetical protein